MITGFLLSALTLFNPGEVTVGGEIGDRMEKAAAYTRSLDIDKTYVRHFRERREKPLMWGGFAGWGMMLDAIVKAAAHRIGGEQMLRFKEKWIAETIRAQTADGSISMFSDKVGIWDNHEQAYMMQALCRDYRWFGNESSLAAAKKLGDFIVSRNIKDNLGLSSAFVLLYEITKDERYAKWLRETAAIEGDNRDYQRVMPVNGVAHVYTWQQRALAQLEYAAATGRRSATFDASTREYFRRILGDYRSITGSMSGGHFWGEIWDDSHCGLGKWGETCVSAYGMRLIVEWMKGNPSTVYGDLYERTMYNAFFAAQNHAGNKYRYFIPFNDPGEWYERDTYCCPNNFRRMIFEIPDAVFFRSDAGFTVNLFSPAALKTKGLTVEMQTDYPRDGKVCLKINSEKSGCASVRVPRWTGLPDAGKWREYRYSAGEQTITFEFPMKIRTIAGRGNQRGKVALMRGPIVYSIAPKNCNWKAEIDCWKIDLDRAPTWTGSGIKVGIFVDNKNGIRREETLMPFTDENRLCTYLPHIGSSAAIVEDELLLSGGADE